MVGFLVKTGLMEIIRDQNADGVQIGDIIYQPGHVIMVYNIERNDNGEVTKITTIETGATFPVYTDYTKESFDSNMISRDRLIIRYTELYKNSDYIPSEFIPVEGEVLPQTYTFNPDVCTFAGDYAAFHSGEEIWINYNLGTTVYTSLELIKDGSVISTLPLVSGNKISLGTNLDPGLYTVELVDDNDRSLPTHFEVIETNVEIIVDNNERNVSFASENGSPIIAQMCDIQGNSRGWIELSNHEKLTGKFSFDPAEVYMSEYGSSIPSDTTYLKVYFRGRYGMVTNSIVDVQ